MDNISPKQSAFKISSTSTEIVVPQYHKDLWTAIGSGLKTGRTYSFASCCCTIFDSRQNKDKKQELKHSDSTTLYVALGKRNFDNETDFSLAMSALEKKFKDTASDVQFNRDHLSFQNSLQIDKLQRELTKHKADTADAIAALMSRIVLLEKDNKQLKAFGNSLQQNLMNEKNHRISLAKSFREVLFLNSENVCGMCKTTPLPPDLPN